MTPAGECNEPLIVSFALGDSAAGVSPGDRIAQGGEGEKKHRSLQDLVGSS